MFANRTTKRTWILAVGLLAAAFVTPAAGPASAQEATAPPLPEDVENVSVPGWSPRLGPADAPVTIVVFGEYLCPFCKRMGPVLRQLQAAYGDKIRIVYRFRVVHSGAEEYALAALAAHKQGKFWAFHAALFENQEVLRERPQFVYRLAERLGLDVEQFRTDMRSESVKKQLEGDEAEAERLGVSGVPTTFINGRELSGARPAEDFGAWIDELLGLDTPTQFTPPEPSTPPEPVEPAGEPSGEGGAVPDAAAPPGVD
ncbi:MAG: DsbA family protein [Deltaproteobacteria bacterium]|nr:DsbA family protein [Deltaproteobacteria bacterium]